MSGTGCLICNRWPVKEDYEVYRRYVTDDHLPSFGLPMSFSEWLSLDEVHHDHRDQAKALDMVIDMEEADLKGERAWLVPQAISAMASAPGEWVDAELPTFTTRFRRRWHKGTGQTSLEMSINGFGATAGESLVYTEGIRDVVPFSVLKYKVVHAMARTLAEKQRSER